MSESWWASLHVQWNGGGVLGEERECGGGVLREERKYGGEFWGREESSIMNQ